MNKKDYKIEYINKNESIFRETFNIDIENYL